MRKLFKGIIMFTFRGVFSQTKEAPKDESWKTIYYATATKINDLVHTKLDVKFDFSKSWMYGKARMALHPHYKENKISASI